jgi:hypothetical protein
MTRPQVAPITLSLVLITFAATSRGDAPQTPTYARPTIGIRSGEPIFQFNGKDLSGFYIYTHKNQYDDPDKVFTVEHGMIRVSGEDYGGFATKQEYGDYHLIVEWKWGDETWGNRQSKARDSGILLHCVGPDGAAGGHWMESIECQIIEGGCGDFILVAGKGRPSLTAETRTGPDGKQLYYMKGGKPVALNSGRFNWDARDPDWKDVLNFRGKDDVEKPYGQWNRMEVVCDGDTITNIVNGNVVNVGTRSSLTKGKIQFQSEMAEIFFRKIEIRPLLKSGSPAGGS